MNLLRSVKMLENNNYFNNTVTNSQTNTHTITVPANTAQLKVMLYWNDPAAAVLAAHTLVNDLDLEVADPSSTVTLPFILDTIPGNVTSTATTGVDHVNCGFRKYHARSTSHRPAGETAVPRSSAI